MSSLNNVQVKKKLILLLIFSSMGLLIFSSLQFCNYYEKDQSMQQIEELVYLSEKISKEEKAISLKMVNGLNDAISNKDQETQKIANVVNKTYQIAINTSSVAKKVIYTLNNKKFGMDILCIS